MHEGLKAFTEFLCHCLAGKHGTKIRFFSRDKYQIEAEGFSTTSYFEDEETGERYAFALTVAKTPRVEQTIPVSTSDDYTFSHPADNGIDHQDTDHAVGRFNTD